MACWAAAPHLLGDGRGRRSLKLFCLGLALVVAGYLAWAVHIISEDVATWEVPLHPRVDPLTTGLCQAMHVDPDPHSKAGCSTNSRSHTYSGLVQVCHLPRYTPWWLIFPNRLLRAGAWVMRGLGAGSSHHQGRAGYPTHNRPELAITPQVSPAPSTRARVCG